MKVVLPALLVFASTASAFVVVVGPTSRSSSTELKMASSSTTRKEFMSQAMFAATTTGLAVSQLLPQPANAAKYGGFGAGSPEVLDPSEVEIDRDVLASDSVQKALKEVQGYQDAVHTMQKALEQNPQVNIRPVIIKELDLSKLRTTLNAINPALDEDSQRGTDRLIRAILQDVTELEIANTQKEGIPRSQRRLDTMKGKLAKLDKAFSDYLAFGK